MKTMFLALRNTKEITRDILNLCFGLGFPIVLLLLLTAIQANIPVSLFEIQKLTPGIAVFGLSFISLFSGMLISKDRSTAFMQRLFTSPLSSKNFIFGYILPLLPMAVLQTVVCFLCAFCLGLKADLFVLLTIAVLIPAALLYIAIGLLCGSLFNDKQVSGICGALLTNISAWLSGTWFDLDLVGGTFQSIANALPFVHAVKAGKAALSGNYEAIMPELIWVIGYATVIMAAAVLIFMKRMKEQ